MSPVGGLFATASGDLRARIWKYTPFGAPSKLLTTSTTSKKTEEESRVQELSE